MKSIAENAGPLIEKEILDTVRTDLKLSIKEFVNHME